MNQRIFGMESIKGLSTSISNTNMKSISLGAIGKSWFFGVSTPLGWIDLNKFLLSSFPPSWKVALGLFDYVFHDLGVQKCHLRLAHSQSIEKFVVSWCWCTLSFAKPKEWPTWPMLSTRLYLKVLCKYFRLKFPDVVLKKWIPDWKGYTDLKKFNKFSTLTQKINRKLRPNMYGRGFVSLEF